MDTETLDRTLSRGFDAGNYGAAYDGLELEASLEKAIFEHDTALDDCDMHSAAFRTAFILGYLSSLELSEMGSDLEPYLEALGSEYGQRCVAAGWVEREADQDVFPPGA